MNDHGQLGIGSSVNVNSPTDVNNLSNVMALEGGFFHSLALLSNGTVWAWGSNLSGQLGRDPETLANSSTPLQVPNLTNIVAIAGGEGHSLALKNDGTVWSWGANEEGQLGDGTFVSRYAPQAVPNLGNITAISCGCTHSLARNSSGIAWAWGRNVEGQLGNGNNTTSNVPVQVSNLTSVQSLNAGSYHGLAIRQDGTVWAWGSNSKGQLGNGSMQNSNVPIQVSLPSGTVSQVSGGYDYSMVLMSTGVVIGWGANEWGQVSPDLSNSVLSPTQVPDVTGVVLVATGAYHTLGRKSDGSVLGWGRDTYGQLGKGNHGGIPESVVAQ